MSLSTADVQKVARLARLAMNDTEIEAARTQLSGIFELIAEMQAVDTTGIAPMSHAQAWNLNAWQRSLERRFLCIPTHS